MSIPKFQNKALVHPEALIILCKYFSVFSIFNDPSVLIKKSKPKKHVFSYRIFMF